MSIPPVIEDVVEAFRRAQLAGDGKAAAALFSADAVMYPPVSERVVRGRPAIDQILQAVHGRLHILEADYGPRAGDVARDMAYVHWTYGLRAQPLSPGAQAITMRGRLLWVLRRKDDDGWRVAAHHASLDPAGPALSSSPGDKR